MIRSQSFNKLEYSPFPFLMLEWPAVGGIHYPRLVGFGKTRLSSCGKIVSLRSGFVKENRELWGYFKIATFPLSLLEAQGNFS